MPVGPQTVVFRWLGYAPTEVQVVVEAGQTVTADAALEAVAVSLGEIVVEGASRAPERISASSAKVSASINWLMSKRSAGSRSMNASSPVFQLQSNTTQLRHL